MEKLQLSPSDFIALVNQTLEYAYPSVNIIGEVSEYRVSQSKWVTFKLKDDEAVIDCFLPVWQLRTQIEDGMQVVVKATPKVAAKWGKFSPTIHSVQPVGEGHIKRSFELLKAKLTKEGLFNSDRKRPLPALPSRIGVISSTEAAGYGDFIKILDERWGGMQVEVAHTQVQGERAPQQMMRALQYFNESSSPVEIIVIIRGGGGLDDLSSFNDEPLVRAIVGSRIPTITGIGHEKDVSLADMAADVVASTPSNAAQILVPDKQEFIHSLHSKLRRVITGLDHSYEIKQQEIDTKLLFLVRNLRTEFENSVNQYKSLSRSLSQLNPRNVLRRGYSLVKLQNSQPIETAKAGDVLDIETSKSIIKAGVTNVRKK
ncbi:MAG: exodeoxyribonuclease VII large subunit [Candidatus Saccharibacteria bacterium]|nr:exodeoxyribonuclease VII large subunit [Candidatus Saccharibacteria bacterium]